MSFACAMFANSSLFRPPRRSSCVIFANSISGRPLTTGITRHICNLNLRAVTARLLACLVETESANETIEKRAIVSCVQIPSRVGPREPRSNAMLANLVSWRYCRQTATCRLEIEIAKTTPQTDTTCRVEIEIASTTLLNMPCCDWDCKSDTRTRRKPSLAHTHIRLRLSGRTHPRKRPEYSRHMGTRTHQPGAETATRPMMRNIRDYVRLTQSQRDNDSGPHVEWRHDDHSFHRRLRTA